MNNNSSVVDQRGDFVFKKLLRLFSRVVNELFQLNNQKAKTSTFLYAVEVEFEYKTIPYSYQQAIEIL